VFSNVRDIGHPFVDFMTRKSLFISRLGYRLEVNTQSTLAS
jgi:hypothetical protein